MALSPDGRYLFSAGWSPLIRVWDLEAKKETRPLEGHEGAIGCVVISPAMADSHSPAVSTTPCGSGMSRAERKKSDSWGTRTSSELWPSNPDGRRAVWGSHDGTICLWDLETGNELHCYRGHTGSVHCAAVSPDGRSILSGGMDGTHSDLGPGIGR